MQNIKNTGERSGPMNIAPALLTKSQVYSYRRRRCMIPDEHMLTQGLNLFAELDGGDPLMSCPVRDVVMQQYATAKRRLAGNSMHLMCIGIFLTACLASARDRPAEIERLIVQSDTQSDTDDGSCNSDDDVE